MIVFHGFYLVVAESNLHCMSNHLAEDLEQEYKTQK